MFSAISRLIKSSILIYSVGIFLLFFVGVWICVSYGVFRLTFELEQAFRSDGIIPIAVLLIYFLASLVILYLWALLLRNALIRAALRASPIRLDGPTTAPIAAFFSAVIPVGILTLGPLLLAGNSSELILMLILPVSIFGLIVATAYRRPLSFIDSNYVLFLRKFGSYADRCVVPVVMEAVPTGTPLIYAVTDEGEAQTWDPVTIGFAGLRGERSGFRDFLARLRAPSRPRFVQTNQANWEMDISNLISYAAVIIVDVSEASAGIGQELSFVLATKSAERTILIANSTAKGAKHLATVNKLFPTHQVMYYQASSSLSQLRRFLSQISILIASMLMLVGAISSIIGLVLTPFIIGWSVRNWRSVDPRGVARESRRVLYKAIEVLLQRPRLEPRDAQGSGFAPSI